MSGSRGNIITPHSRIFIPTRKVIVLNKMLLRRIVISFERKTSFLVRMMRGVASFEISETVYGLYPSVGGMFNIM